MDPKRFKMRRGFVASLMGLLAVVIVLVFQNCGSISLLLNRSTSSGTPPILPDAPPTHRVVPSTGPIGDDNGDGYDGMYVYRVQGFQCNDPSGQPVKATVKLWIETFADRDPELVDPCAGTRTPLSPASLTFVGGNGPYLTYQNHLFERFENIEQVPTAAPFIHKDVVCRSERSNPAMPVPGSRFVYYETYRQQMLVTMVVKEYEMNAAGVVTFLRDRATESCSPLPITSGDALGLYTLWGCSPELEFYHYFQAGLGRLNWEVEGITSAELRCLSASP